MDTEQVNPDPYPSPSYDEVVASLRSQLEEARFQLTVMDLVNTKLLDVIKELEGDNEPTDS